MYYIENTAFPSMSRCSNTGVMKTVFSSVRFLTAVMKTVQFS